MSSHIPSRPVSGPPRGDSTVAPPPATTASGATEAGGTEPGATAPAATATRTTEAGSAEPGAAAAGAAGHGSARAGFADLDGRAVAEHVAVFEAEHARLERELGTIDQV